jgi:hypothetical protein
MKGIPQNLEKPTIPLCTLVTAFLKKPKKDPTDSGGYTRGGEMIILGESETNC